MIGDDGSPIVSGNFIDSSGLYPSNPLSLVRLNSSDGKVDPIFNASNPNNPTTSLIGRIAIDANGNLIGQKSINGNFTGQNLTLDRVNSISGAIDPNENILANLNLIDAIAIDANNNPVIGTTFTNPTTFARQNKLVRLNSDGTIDNTFNPNPSPNNSRIGAIAIDATGKIVVGGNFSNIGGQPRNNLARLNKDGTADPTFPANLFTNGSVNQIVIDANGDLVVGSGSSGYTNNSFDSKS